MIRALVQDALEDGIEGSVRARELCRELEGRVLRFTLTDIGFRAVLLVEDGRLLVVDGPPDVGGGEADAEISMRVSDLMRMTSAERRGAASGGRMAMSGDAVIAQRFSQLLKVAAPDLEEAVASVAGDELARPIAQLVRGVADWGRYAADALAQDLGEYLTEERRMIVSANELEDFHQRVAALRDGVDRAGARLRRIPR